MVKNRTITIFFEGSFGYLRPVSIFLNNGAWISIHNSWISIHCPCHGHAMASHESWMADHGVTTWEQTLTYYVIITNSEWNKNEIDQRHSRLTEQCSNCTVPAHWISLSIDRSPHKTIVIINVKCSSLVVIVLFPFFPYSCKVLFQLFRNSVFK